MHLMKRLVPVLFSSILVSASPIKFASKSLATDEVVFSNTHTPDICQGYNGQCLPAKSNSCEGLRCYPRYRMETGLCLENLNYYLPPRLPHEKEAEIIKSKKTGS